MIRDDISIISNFFEPDCAKELIMYMDKLENEKVMFNRSEGRIGIVNLDDPFLNKMVEKYKNKVVNYFNDGFNKFNGYICTIYQEGAYMSMHSDAEPNVEMGALFYLNEDYEGGELLIEKDFKYKPKSLDMVYFSSHFNHGVAPVTKGKRYFFTISLLKKEKDKEELL
jgi:hypothetical protein